MKHRHKYNIKIFKLHYNCKSTVFMSIWKKLWIKKIHHQIAMNLSKDVFHKIYTLYNNWFIHYLYIIYIYTLSIHYTLIETNDDWFGEQINKIYMFKGISNEMIIIKLKCGKIIIKENTNKIIVLKWKDKRNLFIKLILFTKNSSKIVNIKIKRKKKIF